MKRSLQDHKDLIEAICNRDEDRAVELIRKDIEAIGLAYRGISDIPL